MKNLLILLLCLSGLARSASVISFLPLTSSAVDVVGGYAWAPAGSVTFDSNGLGNLTRGASARLRRLQNGFVRSYALAALLGVVIILGYLLLK